MAVSESRKKANAKWDKENMLTLSVRLKKEIVEQFRQKASENGVSANSVLKQFVEDYIKSQK